LLGKSILICVLLALLLPVGVTADDLTKMIQEELTALGYDTGNVDGEFSTETAVAISQFQAENGLEVTGEASPQLAGIIQAKSSNTGSSAAAAQPTVAQSMDPAALQAAQQACLREKVEKAQSSQKKKRGFGSLMKAVTNTAARFGGNDGLAGQIQETSYEIYKVDATAEDWERAADDLGLTQDDLEECRSPGGATTLNAGVNDAASQSAGPTATAAGAGAMPQLTPEQQEMLAQSGMGEMLENMMGGANPSQPSAAPQPGRNTVPQPDRNTVPPDTYSFSHRISMRVTSSRGTADPVYYVQSGAAYHARKHSDDGLIEFLVYDSQRNLAVLFGEKDGEKGMVYNQMSPETKATLMGAYRGAAQDAPVKSLGSKEILGYSSQGYEISTLVGTTQIWVTSDAPATLFSNLFEWRANLEGEAPLNKNSMVMEVTFTSARTPEDNYHMVCTELQPDTLTLRATDYETS
jgi:peptidoglycan hydrolase-like protein with peptidoglycan-binding domain